MLHDLKCRGLSQGTLSCNGPEVVGSYEKDRRTYYEFKVGPQFSESLKLWKTALDNLLPKVNFRMPPHNALVL